MRICLFFVLLVLSSLSFADVRDDVASCLFIEENEAFLACVDAVLVGNRLSEPKTKETVGDTKWHVTEGTSRIDDSTTVYLKVDSSERILDGYEFVRPSLYIRCAENKTDLYINIDVYLGIGKIPLLIRLDKEKATTESWALSTDSKAVFARGAAIPFAKKLMRHKKLLVRLTPYSSFPVTFEFDVSGLSEAIKPLRKACHW